MALLLCVSADSIETRLDNFDGLIGKVDCEERSAEGSWSSMATILGKYFQQRNLIIRSVRDSPSTKTLVAWLPLNLPLISRRREVAPWSWVLAYSHLLCLETSRQENWSASLISRIRIRRTGWSSCLSRQPLGSSLGFMTCTSQYPSIKQSLIFAESMLTLFAASVVWVAVRIKKIPRKSAFIFFFLTQYIAFIVDTASKFMMIRNS